jgi:hypothetical protein
VAFIRCSFAAGCNCYADGICIVIDVHRESRNCLIQEYTGDGLWGTVVFDEAGAWKREIVKSPLKLEKGFLIVPDAPGIGIELDDEGVEKNVKAFSERPLRTPLHQDGSVADS